MKKPSIPLDIPVGTVVHDAKGAVWVAIGYRINGNLSRAWYFTAAQPYPPHVPWGSLWHGIRTSTILKQFPDLEGKPGVKL